MIAVQALEKRTAELKQKQAQMAALESKVEELEAKHTYFETVVARLEALELRKKHSIQITAERSLSGNSRRDAGVNNSWSKQSEVFLGIP
jgi:prefoldin subunit 5